MEPLWLRVDRNRVKLGWFVVTFVLGSAILLTASMVLLPGILLGLGAAFAGLVSGVLWTIGMWIVVVIAFVWILVIGGIASAVQIANAEDWVRNRFFARDLQPSECPEITGVVHDIALAAGMAVPPRTLLLDIDSVNAFALGTARRNAIIGVTRGMKEQLTPQELRAVVAVLTARIIAGDIMFGTAMAALMGPIRAIRESRKAGANAVGAVGDGCAADGCSGCGDTGGCVDGCASAAFDSDSAEGCLGALGIALFVAVVMAITYAAVVTAAWIVTLWGRALHRTSYEKADAEGMLLLKDPAPMMSALRKCIGAPNDVAVGDTSYDGIFYVSLAGTPAIERVEQRRYDRLREVLGTDGLAAPEIS